MTAARPLPPLHDDARPLWAEILSAMPPAHRRLVLDRLVALNREAAAARAEAARLRPPPSRADRVRQRDAAIRAALWLVEGTSASGRAKALERELRRYSASGWSRERDLAELPAGSSELRRAMHRVMRLSDGRALCWSTLLKAMPA